MCVFRCTPYNDTLRHGQDRIAPAAPAIHPRVDGKKRRHPAPFSRSARLRRRHYFEASARRNGDDAILAGIAWALDREVLDLYHHPDQPTADDLLRGLSPEKQNQVREFIKFLKAS